MADNSLLRLPAVAQARGRSRSQIYAECAAGKMPPPLKLSHKLSAWPAYEIDALNRAEIAGADADEIKRLVLELIARRTQLREPPQAAA